MTDQEDLEETAKVIARDVEMYLDAELPDTEYRAVQHSVKDGTIYIDVEISNAALLEGEIDTLYFTIKFTKKLDPKDLHATLHVEITPKKGLEPCLTPYIKSIAKTITRLALF